jgi:crossover junction endodeoxyribonuclease RuvC
MDYERVIIGVDPGLQCCGWCRMLYSRSGLALYDGGTIRTVAGSSKGAVEATHDRVLEIAAKLSDLFYDDTFDMEHVEVAYESWTYFGPAQAQNFSTPQVNQVIGALLEMSRANDVRATGYTTQKVKQAVTGRAKCGKGQVRKYCEYLLNSKDVFKNASEHAVDAVAVAICHAQHIPMRDAVERATRSRESADDGAVDPAYLAAVRGMVLLPTGQA